MKGLELSEAYYHAFGAPMIQKQFATHQDRIAVGLVGEGSDCFGFDDAISRDHDWGPGFCLWLDSTDYASVGPALQAAYQQLPSQFQGFQRIHTHWGEGRIGVSSIDSFYQRHIGRAAAPTRIEEWFSLPETNLAACTNGKVFYDPLGKFSRIRNDLLSFFPEDVRLAKLVFHCIVAGQSGQYNYMRLTKRGECFAAQYALTKFCAEIIAIAFLINRHYRPFYKWSHRAVRDLPELGPFIYNQILALTTENENKKNFDRIEAVSEAVISSLHSAGLSNTSSSFLLDHGPDIAQKITDPKIRTMVESKI